MTERITRSRLRFGRKVQKLRKGLGFSQENLADILKISRTHMGHLEQGRKAPSMQLVEKMAKAQKTQVKDLFS